MALGPKLMVLLVSAAYAVRSTNQLAEETKAAYAAGALQKSQEEATGDAAEQLSGIWEKIMADGGVAAPMPSALAPLKLMAAAREIPLLGHLVKWSGLTEDLNATFSWRHDEPLPQSPPPAHQKLIHPVGSVAKVSLVWDEEAIKKLGYTGVFTSQQDQALLRMGPAGALKKEGMAPGIGLKIFRDNQESVNTVMLYSLRGQAGFNHFNHTLCNKLNDFRDKNFAEKLLLKSFKTASKYPFTTGLSQWAEGPEGEAETNFPYVLCLRPTDDVRKSFKDFNDYKFEHIQEQLKTLNAKKIIYQIYAASEPRTDPIQIGYVQLQTKFHATKFGDTELFFRHDWFEKDLELKPHWKTLVDHPDFWFSEGAPHFYNTIDPGSAFSKSYSGKNAWIGGYNPANTWEVSTDLKKITSETGDSMLQSDTGNEAESSGELACPFAYLHQGEDSFVHHVLG